MTAAEFKKKWSRYQGKETSAYQGHFDDLCRLLGQPTPAEADPSGSEFFCYQKRVVKDLELFELRDAPDDASPGERGFADVWKKGCFAWEYKGKKKNLDEAYKQLLRYREALLNPPLLVVCDFDRYIVRTNFNGTVQETHEFTNDQIDRPENWRILRALFDNPDFLKPQRTTAQVTESLAEQIAAAAKELNELRERWLNPPEWTMERILEFPGSAKGPWSRFIDRSTLHEVGRAVPSAPQRERTAEDSRPYLVGTVRYPRLEARDADCAAKLKKRTLTNLYNERPAWLDLAHKKLDAAVAAAYGWPADLGDEQILERLLALNLERAAEEEKAAKTRPARASRGKREDELV